MGINPTTLAKIIEAGELTDLPGHCKICGTEIEVAHLMYDPDGRGTPIEFCSASCLHDAETLFSGLSAQQLDKVDELISEQELAAKPRIH